MSVVETRPGLTKNLPEAYQGRSAASRGSPAASAMVTINPRSMRFCRPALRLTNLSDGQHASALTELVPPDDVDHGEAVDHQGRDQVDWAANWPRLQGVRPGASAFVDLLIRYSLSSLDPSSSTGPASVSITGDFIAIE